MIRAVAPRFSQHRTRGGGLNATDNSSWVGSTRYRKVGSAYRTAGRSSPRRFRSLATFLRGISLTLIGCVACFSLVSVCFTNHSDDLFLLDQPFGTSFENDYSRRPRVLQIDKSLKNVFPITSPTEPQHSKRKVVPLISSKSVKILDDSDEYPRAEDPETDHCKPMYSWQKSSFPSCNLVHEIDLTNSLAENASEVLAYGAYRDVWSITGMDKNRYVLKTMLYERDFTVRNFDRYRRDAVAMERLTSSELILDIYGFCGSSAATEFADGGDLETTLWGDIDIYEEPEIPESRLTDVEKLEIATEAARSLADFHFLGEDSNEDRPIMAHTDIKLSQFVKVGSKFKLNDFNRARFLMWNEEKKKICTYRVGKNGGKYRSPEEYLLGPQTEKVDVYSLGNVIYALTMNTYQFYNESSKVAKEKVIRGDRPPILPHVITRRRNSTIMDTLLHVMSLCFEHDPDKRPTSRQVANLLKDRLEKETISIQARREKL